MAPSPLRLAALPRPRPKPQIDPSTTQLTRHLTALSGARLTVGVAATCDAAGQWTFGWATEDGTVAAGRAIGAGDEVAALRTAVLAVLAATDPNRALELRVPHEGLVTSLADGHAGKDLTAALGARNITTPWHPSAPRGLLVRRARVAAGGGTEMAAPTSANATGSGIHATPDDLTPPAALLAATDGSKGRGPLCGWSFVTASGRHRSGTCTGNILAAELTAIQMLLQHTAKGSTLHVLVDSRAALAAIRDSADNGARGWVSETGAPVTHKTILSAIARLRVERTVTFAWVKGHAGQPLNDAADRLARLARRAEESALGGLPLAASTRDALCAQIVADMNDGLRAADVCAGSPAAA